MTVLDLDENRVITLADGRAEAGPLPSPLAGLAPPGPVVIVESAGTPDLARLEAVHRAMGAREIHSCGRLAAAAAAVAEEGFAGVLLVCDLTWTTLRAGFVEVDGVNIRVRRTVDLPGLGVGAFLEDVAPGLAGPALAAALTVDPRRVSTVTEEAADDPLYLDVPVAHADGHAVTAGALLDAVTRYRIDLVGRLGMLQPADAARTVLSGAFTEFVLLPGLFAMATGRDPVVRPDAVAEGAGFLAEGRFAEPAPEPVWVTLPLHRTHGGRFEETLITIPSQGGSFAVLDGEMLLLGLDTDVPCHLRLSLDEPLRVEIDGTAVEIGLSGLPAAGYQIGLRLRRQSVAHLVFFDPDGSDPVFVPLETRTHP